MHAQTAPPAESPPPAPITAAPPPPVSFEPFGSTPPSSYAADTLGATSVFGTPASSIYEGVEGFAQNPLRLGPFQLHPNANYRFTYGNGINRQPGNQEDVAQHRIAPGIAAVSPHVTLFYTPSLNYYSSENFEDHVDHRTGLSATFGAGDWTFRISQSYIKTSSPSVETASQTERQSFSTALFAHYQYTQRISFDFTTSLGIQDTSGFQNARTWSTMEWVNYHLSEKTMLGVGMGGGYVDVELGSDMTYEQVQGRISWAPGPKLNVNLNGGVEFRQFLAEDGTSDRVNPLMGASIGYSPFDYTTFSLNADHSVRTSIFADQITEVSTLSASISQRFLQHFNFRLSAGVNFSEYQASTTGTASGRSDDYAYVSPSISTRIFKKGSASVFYSHSENISSSAGFGFSSDQYGFSLGYRF